MEMEKRINSQEQEEDVIDLMEIAFTFDKYGT